MESYSICAHVTLAIESVYTADEEMKKETRKEEQQKKRILDTGDRNRFDEEFMKYSRPLTTTMAMANGECFCQRP